MKKMLVICARHGYAGSSIPDDAAKDDARQLTPSGARAVKAVASHLADEGIRPTKICHSPAVRAAQSAKILGGILGTPTAEEPLLYIHGPLSVLLRRFADDGEKRVVLVSHDDVLENGLHQLDRASPKQVVDKYAMGEARAFDFDRDDLSWSERMRVLPSDLGEEDVYDHAAKIFHSP